MTRHGMTAEGSTKMQFVLPVDTKARLQERAEAENVPMTAILLRGLDKELAVPLPKPKKARQRR